MSLRKGANEKALLAWLVRRNSVVSNAWIAERLQMGRADCLSRYPRKTDETKDVELIKKRERLLKLLTPFQDRYMDLLRNIEITTPYTKYKQSPLTHAIALAIFACLIMGAICWHFIGNFPLNAVLGCSGIMGLFALTSLSMFKKTLASENWLLILTPDIAYINIRSYLNANFPQTDPHIVRVHLTEIESARITKQRVARYGFSGSRQTTFHKFLDLNMAGQALSPLKEQLNHERNMEAPLTGKVVKYRSKSKHHPVSVVDNQTIRIEWRSHTGNVAPNIKNAIELLSSRGIKIKFLKNEAVDLTQSSASQKCAEEKIIILAQRGEVLAAAKLARRVYGMSLAEAQKFVKELTQ